MKNTLLGLFVIGLLSVAPATADTINFEQLSSGDLGSGPVTVDGVTFNGAPNLYNNSSFHFTGEGGSICAFDPGAFDCANDMTVNFNGKVKRLSLATAGYHAGDSVTISVFRRKNNLGSLIIQADQVVNLRGYGRVTRLVFDDNSVGGAGYAYGKFKFKRLTTTSKQDDSAKTRRRAN